nr:clionin [Ambigolimax valentianus]
MSSSVVLSAMALLVTLACLLTSTTSSPLGAVEPVVPLDQMEPDHACLFICSICFPEAEDTEQLMDCSNKVCGPVMAGLCAMEKFIWLGHHCRHYNNVESMWTAQTKH